MAVKHTQVLKQNFATAIRQWGLPRAEKELRKMKAKRVELPLVFELCGDCGAIKAINGDCQPCRRVAAAKRINAKKSKKRKIAKVMGWGAASAAVR